MLKVAAFIQLAQIPTLRTTRAPFKGSFKGFVRMLEDAVRVFL